MLVYLIFVKVKKDYNKFMKDQMIKVKKDN